MKIKHHQLKAYIDNKQDVIWTAVGDSMHPTICAGDKVTVTSEVDKITEGDIVIFYNPKSKRYIAHRVIAFLGNRLVITKGDNNSYCDPPVHRSVIIGKIILIEKGINYEKIIK